MRILLFDTWLSSRKIPPSRARYGGEARESGSLNVSHSLWRQSGVEKKERKTLRFSCSTSRRTGSSTRSSAATSGTRRPYSAAAEAAPSVRAEGRRKQEGAASGIAGASLAAALRIPAAGRSSEGGLPGRIWGRSLPGSLRGGRLRRWWWGSLFFLGGESRWRRSRLRRRGRGEGATSDNVRQIMCLLQALSPSFFLSLSLSDAPGGG